MPDLSLPLLERESVLQSLLQRVAALRGDSACGHNVVLRGEAGIGKTVVLRALQAQAGDDVTWLWGSCEPLLAPPPLAALIDLLDQLPPTLAAAVRGGRTTPEVLAGMLALLRERARPLVLVIDDAQWADSATLDLLRYLARRIDATRAILVLAARSEALATGHPLHALLGHLPPRHTDRIELAPLSREAVAELAHRAGRSARGLYRATLGNPFFATECLAGQDGALPVSVRDAVLARTALLSETARDLLELVSVSPSGLEVAIADAVLDGCAAAIDDCSQAGLLQRQGDLLRFRHELARQALESACPPRRAAALHGVVFDALSQQGAGAARCVHHAEHAGMTEAVLRLAPAAAAEAAAASAHRQAAMLYALALVRGHALAAHERAALLVAHADECMLTGQFALALQSRLQALALHREHGDHLREGEDLRLLARLEWLRGAPEAGQPYAAQAIEVLERTAASADERAMAYATMAQLHLLGPSPQAAYDWGSKALATFETTGHAVGRSYALNTVATARLRAHDDPRAWVQLRQSLALALEHGFEEHAARAYLNLPSLGLVHRRLPEVLQICSEGLAYCDARDLDTFSARLHLRRAYALLELGRWSEVLPALADAQSVPQLGPMETEQVHHLRQLLALRQGDESAPVREYWQRLIEGRFRLAVDPWYTPQAVTAAEAAWLGGDVAAVQAIVRDAWPVARASGEPWRLGQLACWMRRAGAAATQQLDLPPLPDPTQPAPQPSVVAPPCALELAGDPRAAAASWAELGCRYEQAQALAACDDTGAWQEALALADEVGASALARVLRRRLRTAGVHTRSRNRLTRSDPLGLTVRERQVLAGLRDGLSNREIAARLVRSARTVDHHVAALMAKLGACTRAEAVRLAGAAQDQRPATLRDAPRHDEPE